MSDPGWGHLFEELNYPPNFYLTLVRMGETAPDLDCRRSGKKENALKLQRNHQNSELSENKPKKKTSFCTTNLSYLTVMALAVSLWCSAGRPLYFFFVFQLSAIVAGVVPFNKTPEPSVLQPTKALHSFSPTEPVRRHCWSSVLSACVWFLIWINSKGLHSKYLSWVIYFISLWARVMTSVLEHWISQYSGKRAAVRISFLTSVINTNIKRSREKLWKQKRTSSLFFSPTHIKLISQNFPLRASPPSIKSNWHLRTSGF